MQENACILRLFLLLTNKVNDSPSSSSPPLTMREGLIRWRPNAAGLQRQCHAWSCPSDRKGHDGLGSKQAHRESQPAVVAGSSFSRTFRDQRPTHNKRDSKREAEIERDGPKKVSRVSRKDAMNQKNPCGPPVITQTPSLLLSPKNSQRDFLENVCETSTLSQGSLLHPVPDEVSSDLNSILTC